MKKYGTLKKVILFSLIIAGVYLAGPKPGFKNIDWNKNVVRFSAKNPDSILQAQASEIQDLKPDNQSTLQWFDTTTKAKTDKVVVYLHGFSASPYEGKELATAFGKRYGCNVFFPRLADHGRKSPDSFKELTPSEYIQSAQDALQFAKQLGDSIIVISCSTGSTLGLILAAGGEKIHSHFMYSPNIRIANPAMKLLLYPWGKQIGQLVLGGNYNKLTYNAEQAKYWNSVYHINGLIALQSLLEQYMQPDVFKKVYHPVFMGYYYKNENEQDDVVSVEAMSDMFAQLSTPEDFKKKVAFPLAGTHMMISPLFSKQMEEIKQQTFIFAENKMGMKPIDNHGLIH